MKNSTFFLVLIAVAVCFFAFYRSSRTQGPDLNGPRFQLTGQVQKRLPEGVLVICQRKALSVIGAPPSSDDQGGDYNRVLLRAHPGESRLVDNEKINVQAVENGVFQRNGETLRAYWYAGAAPQPTPIVIKSPDWHNPLNDPVKRVGRRF